MVVIDIDGAGRDVGGHDAEVLEGEELGLDVLGEDIGVLLDEGDDDGVIVALHVLLLNVVSNRYHGIMVDGSVEGIGSAKGTIHCTERILKRGPSRT